MRNGRRWLAPEVVQSSAMDCGPAALKALLEGFGISASYGRLREACQTDVDGTSIDALEEAALQLGLDAEQVVVPFDHLLMPEAEVLPAIVALWLPGKLTHFVVAWRRHGGFVQVMDPSTGRRWPSTVRFLHELYCHEMEIQADDWMAWATSDDFLLPFRRRLVDLGVSGADSDQLIRRGLDAGSWQVLAGMDASVRMISGLVVARALPRGAEANRAVQNLTRDGLEDPSVLRETIPPGYWSARPASGKALEDRLTLRGALLVTVRRARDELDRSAEERRPRPALSPDLQAALDEPPSRPGRDLVRLLRAGGVWSTGAILLALVLAAGTVAAEAVLLRAFINLGDALSLPIQRWAAVAMLGLFLAVLMAMHTSIALGLLRVGRQLEARLRVSFLHKLPRLGDRYFHSRLTADMAERSHSVHTVRSVPLLAGRFLQILAEMLFIVVGITWLDPRSGIIAALGAGLVVAIPVLVAPALAERDLRVRVHTGALTRFVLDGLMGLMPIRSHCADRPVRRQHEALLADWGRARLSFHRLESMVTAAHTVAGLSAAAWLLWAHLAHSGQGTGPLLMAYWALRIPLLGQEIAALARQYPSRRNVTLRLLEPLGAPEEASWELAGRSGSAPESAGERRGVAVALSGVSVRAGGHTILDQVDLSLDSGAEVAIVGPSGAGKSTLVGLLLGWCQPAAGSIHIDGQTLDARGLAALREATAWVDPAVQLWNRSLAANLTYGLSAHSPPWLMRAMDAAELRAILAGLPDGLATPLGEGGGLLSGGEGQRVRLSRALLRPDVRLVILDEPFRGLDRGLRRELLGRARQMWRGATLLCVTHDVSETRDFARVLVVESARLVEDGDPAILAGDPRSRYRALLDAEDTLHSQAWSGGAWRRLTLQDGRLRAP